AEENMEAHSLLLIWICLVIGSSAQASPGAGSLGLTTICVEIRPSSPQEEPYYMCRGANFEAENRHQSCVAVKSQGENGEPVYVCRGVEYQSPAGDRRPVQDLFPDTNHKQQIPAVPTFPSFPAFGGGSFAQQQQSQYQAIDAPPHPQSTPYQEQPYQPHQPTPEQQQPATRFGFYGNHMAATPASPAAQPYGVPAVFQPPLVGPQAAPSGAAVGPGSTAPTPSHDPAANQGAANTFRQSELVGSSRHRPGLDEEILSMPNVEHSREELNQQYRRPVEQRTNPQEQMMWVPLAQTQDPHEDPVMRAFYKSLAVAEPTSNREEQLPRYIAAPTNPIVGQYQQGPPPPPFPPSPQAYVQQELTNPTHCSECSASAPNVQCPTSPIGDGMKYICPTFQPVIIAMPCYSPQQPVRAQIAAAPVPNPYVQSFGMGGQVGSPQMLGQAFGRDPQVSAPFGLPMGVGPIINPFGPFGNLNPFNPFNRILGSPPTAAPRPMPNPNFFERVFNFNGGTTEGSLTTDSLVAAEVTTARSGKLNFSATTPVPTTPMAETPNVAEPAPHDGGDDGADSAEDEGEDEEEVEGKSTPSPSTFEADESGDEKDSKTAKQLVNKATELLASEKRKRHNSRSSIPQKRKYLQQL
ncbi:hypothetical protein KR018_007101, partial [Drosophila ironensis]